MHKGANPLGDWVIPENTKLILSIRLVHESEESFPDAASFNPDRFLGAGPKPAAWIPFGGGVNRCVGAGFANMEMDSPCAHCCANCVSRQPMRRRTTALARCGDRAGTGCTSGGLPANLQGVQWC